MHRIIMCAAVGIALAGCDQQEAGPVDAEVAPTSAADAAQTLENERSLADETEAGPTRARDEASGKNIPARFHGVWAAQDSDCMAGAETRVEITAGEIAFHESAGIVTGATGKDDRIVVGLAMAGEGEDWATRFLLDLDGDRLTIEDIDLQDGESAQVRVRCSG